MTVVAVLLLVVSKKICMDGNPIGDVRTEPRSAKLNSITMQYTKPMTPLTTTDLTIAVGTFLFGCESPSERCMAAS